MSTVVFSASAMTTVKGIKARYFQIECLFLLSKIVIPEIFVQQKKKTQKLISETSKLPTFRPFLGCNHICSTYVPEVKHFFRCFSYI